MTNRLDTGLLFLPALAYAWWTTPLPLRQRLGLIALGMAPLVLWELFALVYYGFPFPNTAYAKLNAGLISRAELLEHGLAYLDNSLRWDPVTWGVILLSSAVVLTRRKRCLFAPWLGTSLYLLYVVYIGGDFMSGRFFAAPLLVGVVLLAHTELRPAPFLPLGLVVLVIALGLRGPYVPLLFDGGHSAGEDAHGITDEKGNYWSSTALVQRLRGKQLPDHDWAREGQAARQHNPGVVPKGSVGFYGYFAGPQVHVVDLLALADPLLARLPPVDPNWRVGHLGRRPPAGYLETLASGENHIADPNLAYYYDKLSLIIRGPLFAPERLGEIWRFNTGAYTPYIRAYALSDGPTFVQRLRLTNPTDQPYVVAFVWNNGRAQAYVLDEASRRGHTYTVTWHITPHGVQFEGRYVRQLSAIGPLNDQETLNVGLILSPSADLSSYEIYEYRYWFRLDGERLRVAQQGIGWYNDQAPGGWWREADVSPAIQRQ